MLSGGHIPAVLLWLPCALFVIHDLEEALFLMPWLHRNQKMLALRFPLLSYRILRHFDRISAPIFAVMAAEELALLVAVTVYAQLWGQYTLWLALFLAFAIHLALHLAQWLVVRRYIPALATSLLCLPICIWLLFAIENSRPFSVRELVLCALLGLLAAGANLFVIHRIGAQLSQRRA